MALAAAASPSVAAAQETATPVASSSPSPSPSPPAPLSPAPAPSAPSAPLTVDRTQAAILPGATLLVAVAGGSGTIGVRSSGPSVDASFDPSSHTLALAGRAPGRAVVTVFDEAGGSASIDVLVAPPAGVVPAAVTVELGGTVSPRFAAEKIRAAIAAAAQLRPGARLEVSGSTPPAPLQPGGSFDAVARVHLDGASAYVDADGATSVHVSVVSLAQIDPAFLFYSDDPEKLSADTDGVLYRGTLEPGTPARLYFYHVADASTHGLYLALRATGGDARLDLLGAAAGPTNAFAYVGHVSTLRYLLERAAGESAIVSAAVDAPYLMRLGNADERPGELIAGAFDLAILDGGPVEVDVVSTDGLRDPADLLAQPELPGDGHGRRGEFDLRAVPPIALALTAGTPDPQPVDVGEAILPNLRPGGRALGGDYGVLRDVSLTLSDPGPDPATVYLYEQPGGAGGSTSTIWFAGDPAPTELPCVIRPNRYAIKAFSLAPGATQTVSAQYMTDGASTFPLDFGLTAVPPSPLPGPSSPDACNPRPEPSP